MAIINTGTAADPVYKYDCYTGIFDFSGFATKVAGGTTGNFASLDANGNPVDAGIAYGDILTAADISDYTEAELRTLLGLPAAE